MKKIKTITEEVVLNSFSLYPYTLPTFQKARTKTVYCYWFGLFKCKIAKYLFFQEISFTENTEYTTRYKRIR